MTSQRHRERDAERYWANRPPKKKETTTMTRSTEAAEAKLKKASAVVEAAGKAAEDARREVEAINAANREENRLKGLEDEAKRVAKWHERKALETKRGRKADDSDSRLGL
jgi:hypothetical protein